MAIKYELTLEFILKVYMEKFLLLLSSFTLAIIALTGQSFAALTKPQKEMFVFGVITAVCEMHHENNLSYSIAKKYTKQYIYNAERKYLSRSEIEFLKETVLELYPSCPFPK